MRSSIRWIYVWYGLAGLALIITFYNLYLYTTINPQLGMYGRDNPAIPPFAGNISRFIFLLKMQFLFSFLLFAAVRLTHVSIKNNVVRGLL